MTDSGNGGSSRCKAFGRKALRIFDNFRDWFNRLEFIIKLIISIGTIFSLLGLGYFFSEDEITVDFNPIANCKRGSLYGLQASTALPSSLILVDKAAELSICDNEALTARKSKFLADLVAKYPGCVRFEKEKNKLHMLFNPLAICRSTSTNYAGFFCDGAKDEARKSPAENILVESHSQLRDCTDGFFMVESRPK